MHDIILKTQVKLFIFLLGGSDVCPNCVDFYSRLPKNVLWLVFFFSYSFRKDHEKCTFEVHEVYAVDILVTSGEGKVINFEEVEK